MNKAFGALLLPICVSVLFCVCGQAAAEEPTQAVSYQELARAIIHRQDQVDVEALADWIIQGRADFLLIDIRPQADFDAGHIQSAQSMPLSYLVENQTLKHLPRDRKLVLYSNGNRKAAQAVVMLRLAGLDAYALLGGYQFWNDRVLHPELAADAGDDEILRFRKRQAVACYFAGNYKGGTGGAPAAGFTPQVRRKPPTRETKEGAPKIKEGC
jgi:rhodanese-related sulfurtransferase